MNFTATFSVMFRLVQDTFRQSMAAGICWLLMGMSTICILGCLSVSVSGPRNLTPPGENATFLPRFDQEAQDPHKLQTSGVAVADGTLGLGFGAVRVAVARDIPAAVHFFQLILAAGVADTLGLLLTLIWTAGFLPGFLAPQSLAVLLAKPVPRWTLLAGKYIGVLAFVLAQAVYFVGGTWLALGLRTSVWDPTYLLCIPLLLLQFAVFFGFSLLLAVCCRSTVVCVFGSIAFWAICWAINFGRHAVTLGRRDRRRMAAAKFFLGRRVADGHRLLDLAQAGRSRLSLLRRPRRANELPSHPRSRRPLAWPLGAHVAGLHDLSAHRRRAAVREDGLLNGLGDDW